MNTTKIHTPLDVFDACAKVYQELFMDVSLYHNQLKRFSKLLPKGAEILDLACGPGNLTKYLLEQHSDLDVLGIDISSEMINLAKTNNPKARFQVLDCRKMVNLDEQFDAIIAGFCFPYLNESEVVSCIKDCTNLLNKDGLIYISTMEKEHNTSEIESSSSGKFRTQMYYYSYNFLINTLEALNFEVLISERIENKQPNGKLSSDLIIIAKLNQ